MYGSGSGFQSHFIKPGLIFQHIQRVLQFGDLFFHGFPLIHDNLQTLCNGGVTLITEKGKGTDLFDRHACPLQGGDDEQPFKIRFLKNAVAVLIPLNEIKQAFFAVKTNCMR